MAKIAYITLEFDNTWELLGQLQSITAKELEQYTRFEFPRSSLKIHTSETDPKIQQLIKDLERVEFLNGRMCRVLPSKLNFDE